MPDVELELFDDGGLLYRLCIRCCIGVIAGEHVGDSWQRGWHGERRV
jgi:hypothetical protein